MSMKLVVALFASVISASAAMAAQSLQPKAAAGFDLAGRLTPAEAASSLRRKPATPLLRHATVQLPKAALPSLGGYRSQRDERQGAATFLWAAADVRPATLAPLKAELMADSAARGYLGAQGVQLNAGKRSIASAKLLDLHDTGSGPLIARYQQIEDGVPVFGKRVNVMMDRGMKLVASSGNFAAVPSDKRAAQAKATNAFRLTADDALATAWADFSGEPRSALSFGLLRKAGDYSIHRPSPSYGDIRPVGEQRSRKFWYPMEGRLVPAWYAEIHARSVDQADDYAYGYLISAEDGKVLFRKNLIAYDAYTYRTYAETSGTFQPFDGPLGNGYDPFVGTPGNGTTARVPVATNLVTLQNGPISTNDPWLPPGATETRGNNVDAYLDLFGTPNGTSNPSVGQGFDPGTTDRRAGTTAAGQFDYPYTPDADPSTESQRSFAVVNLFYLNNWLHDWWYDVGFDEAAGNAQADNYGRGGQGGDRMLVEAQDFSGRNNANMGTPPDGGSPRMQQYLFDGQAGELRITPAGGTAYTVAVNTASFGPTTFDVSGTVIASAPLNGCTAFTNAGDVAGKIVIVNRGSCTFKTKTLMAQNAGALGVILHNNAAGLPPGLADDATITTPITIGTLSVSLGDGQRIRNDGAVTPVAGRLSRLPVPDIDSAVDAQIVAHEWFHYASNRLVGDALGLGGSQGSGMGEGWSDFSGMLLTVRPEDRGVAGNELYQGAYPQSYYSTGDSYFGIRRAPYSTDFAIFPLTFKHIENGVPLPTTAPIAFGGNGATNAEVHNVGEIWANTLWEIYAALLNDPRHSFLQAQEKMKRYIIAGLKMTPNTPTLLEARDALLASAYATDRADFELMATAFAKRGMGVGAVAPDRFDEDNTGVVESNVALAGGFEVIEASLDFGYVNGADGFLDNDGVLDPGETALLTVKLRSTGTRDLTSPVTVELSADADIAFGSSTLNIPASPSAPIAYQDEVTAQTTVKLNAASSTAQLVTFTLEFPEVGAANDEVIEADPVQIQTFVNYDLAAGQRDGENLDDEPLAAVPDWKPVLIGSGVGWEVTDTDGFFGTGLAWYSPDNPAPADLRITTPPVVVGRSNFALSFDHYYQLEFAGFDGATPVGYDGAVVEISDDDGATWTDVADAGGTFQPAAAGYNGYFFALAPDGTHTPDGSGAHIGFVGDNFAANGGNLQTVTINFGTAFQGKTVRLRFRQASDVAVGEFGWVIDNIRFTGITNRPFSEVVAENSVVENQAPVARATATNPVQLGSVATLDGSGSSDPDGDALSYAWVQTAGPATPITNANAAVATVTPTAAGSYSFQLTVTDVRALTSTATVTLLVNRAPVASAGPDRVVMPGASATLDGSASSDPEGDALSYSWVQSSGPPLAAIATPNASTTTVTPPVAGTYLFTLTVTDANGASSTDTVTVNASRDPVANAGPDQVVLSGGTATLDGGASADPEGGVLTYAWTQVSGPATTISNANTRVATVTPTAAGSYVFRLTVTDDGGFSASDTVTVSVNQPPVANAGADQTVTPGSVVTLGGTSSDPDSDPLSYAWTQTSGPATPVGNANQANAVVQPQAEGSYVFLLTVTDARGATSTDSVTVMVADKDGGGGAFGVGLLLPAFALLALRRRRRS